MGLPKALCIHLEYLTETALNGVFIGPLSVRRMIFYIVISVITVDLTID